VRDWGSFLWEGGVFKGLEEVEFFPGWYVNDEVVEVEKVEEQDEGVLYHRSGFWRSELKPANQSASMSISPRSRRCQKPFGLVLLMQLFTQPGGMS
jgi:hypothetical protein